MTRADPPPRAVLEAFEAEGDPVLLPCGTRPGLAHRPARAQAARPHAAWKAEGAPPELAAAVDPSTSCAP